MNVDFVYIVNIPVDEEIMQRLAKSSMRKASASYIDRGTVDQADNHEEHKTTYMGVAGDIYDRVYPSVIPEKSKYRTMPGVNS